VNISGLHNRSLQELYKKQVDRTAQSGAAGEARESAPRVEGDSVELSPNAQLLQKVLQELQKGEDAPSERVEQLRQQVREGNYEVPLQKLTARLFADLF